MGTDPVSKYNPGIGVDFGAPNTCRSKFLSTRFSTSIFSIVNFKEDSLLSSIDDKRIAFLNVEAT